MKIIEKRVSFYRTGPDDPEKAFINVEVLGLENAAEREFVWSSFQDLIIKLETGECPGLTEAEKPAPAKRTPRQRAAAVEAEKIVAEAREKGAAEAVQAFEDASLAAEDAAAEEAAILAAAEREDTPPPSEAQELHDILKGEKVQDADKKTPQADKVQDKAEAVAADKADTPEAKEPAKESEKPTPAAKSEDKTPDKPKDKAAALVEPDMDALLAQFTRKTPTAAEINDNMKQFMLSHFGEDADRPGMPKVEGTQALMQFKADNVESYPQKKVGDMDKNERARAAAYLELFKYQVLSGKLVVDDTLGV